MRRFFVLLKIFYHAVDEAFQTKYSSKGGTECSVTLLSLTPKIR